MRIFRPAYTKPMPVDAKVFTRKGKRWARFAGGQARLTKSGDRILCEVTHWHIEFRDAFDIHRKLKGFSNKQVTETLAGRIEDLLHCKANSERPDTGLQRWLADVPSRIRNELIAFGLLDTERTTAGKLLAELIDEFEVWLKTTKVPRHGFLRSDDYVRPTVSCIRKIADCCRFAYWSDIRLDEVEKYLGGLCLSRRTYNGYATAFKQFCQWIVDNRRASESPVNGLKKLELEDNEYRRALTPDEVSRFLAATENAPIRYGMMGHERAVLYLLAIETGLRRKEIMSLTASSFDFDKRTVTVEAGDAKSRKKTVRYLKQKRVKQLRGFLGGKLPHVKVFDLSRHWRSADMIKADLKAAEIQFTDENGARCDLHACRHTYATALDSTTASLTERMALMGHGTKGNMTLGYTHVVPDRLREIVEQLPDYNWPQRAKLEARQSG